MRAKRLSLAVLGFMALGGLAACAKKDGAPPTAASAKVARYKCPMHPFYTSDRPGDCPICNMRLVPIDAGASPSSGTVAGQGIVSLTPGSEARIGVAVSPVEKRDLTLTIKAPGRVAYDPTLYSAILEYQEARKNHAAGSSESRAESDMTIRASKLRLRQMGLSNEQIEDMGRPGFDASNLLLGQPGGKVWVYVDIYDFEAGFVKTGQPVTFTSPALPGQEVAGTVRAVDSILNSETRTLRVRAEVPNPRGDLKPEMYLSATIRADIGTRLAVPDSAVLDTGVRQLVYVQTAPGRFEPREVRVGREATGFYEVISGVKDGEQVVTQANFLIDSESKIRGGESR